MNKRKSGPELGVVNVKLVDAWIKERNNRLDWLEYGHNNRINRRAVARELGFADSVCTQNHGVRALLQAADLLWFKSEVEDKVAHEAARERAQVRSSRVGHENSDLITRVAELEAENRQMRRELNAVKKLQAIVECDFAGFRL